MAEKNIPTRTCIACRNEFNKHSLLRIVKSKDGNLFVDKSGKANGRGAYICSSTECVKRLVKSRLLDKTFKIPVSIEIYTSIEEDILGKK